MPEMNASERIRGCIELLGPVGSAYRKYIEASGQVDDPVATMVTGGVGFGRSSLNAIATLIQVPETVFQAGTLCRSYYELSVRFLWAAREPDGWQRLQAYWAKENERFAKHSRDCNPQSEGAQETLRNARMILERRDENGNPFSPDVDVKSMLLRIQKRNREQGINGNEERFPQWQYAYVWLYWSRYVHAHLEEILNPDPKGVLSRATLTAIYATFLLLQTVFHVSENDLDDVKAFIDSAREHIRKLLDGCDELDFGEGGKPTS